MTTEGTQQQNDDVLVVVDKSENKPAADADAQKTAQQDATPAPGADDKKPDGSSNADQESPEKQAERKLSRRQRAYQRERDARVAAETENRLLREQLERGKPEAGKQDTGEPKRDDFESYEAYLDARQDWRDEQRARKNGSEQTRQDAPKQDTRPPAEDAAMKAWNERERDFEKATKDYGNAVREYMEDDIGQLSHGARQAIADSNVGPQLLYHLAKNPAVHDRIAELSGARQVAELVKLEDELAKPAEKKQTGAPPPPNPLPGGGKSAGSGFHENMSDADYRALRKSQGARWAR